MILQSFCCLFPKSITCLVIRPRAEFFDARDGAENLFTRRWSDARDLIENGFRVSLFARAAIVVDRKSVSFVSDFLEEHELG